MSTDFMVYKRYMDPVEVGSRFSCRPRQSEKEFGVHVIHHDQSASTVKELGRRDNSRYEARHQHFTSPGTLSALAEAKSKGLLPSTDFGDRVFGHS